MEGSFNPRKENPPTPWEPNSYYVVLVSMRPGNPYHRSLLYTGFLSTGKLGGSAGLINPCYEPEMLPLDHDHRMKIVVLQNLGKLLEDNNED